MKSRFFLSFSSRCRHQAERQLQQQVFPQLRVDVSSRHAFDQSNAVSPPVPVVWIWFLKFTNRVNCESESGVFSRSKSFLQSNSAESVAMGLLRQFEGMQLPAASELDWLVPEQDAPQKVVGYDLARSQKDWQRGMLTLVWLSPPAAAAHPRLPAHLPRRRRARRHLQAEDSSARKPGMGAAAAADHLQHPPCSQVSQEREAGVTFSPSPWRQELLLCLLGCCHALL